MKKLLILTLAIFSFVACNQAAEPALHAKENAAQSSKNYILPALKGESYNFTEKINQKPVVVAFMAGFCGYCKAMLPYMDTIAKQVPASHADVIAAFMDKEPTGLLELEPIKNAKNIKIYYGAADLMEEQGITGFPTIMLFKDGKVVETWRGYSPKHVESILETLRNLK